MECVVDVDRIGKELGANVTAGYDGIEGAYFIWAAKEGFELKLYYSESDVMYVRDISIIEDSFIESARAKDTITVPENI